MRAQIQTVEERYSRTGRLLPKSGRSKPATVADIGCSVRTDSVGTAKETFVFSVRWRKRERTSSGRFARYWRGVALEKRSRVR
jgi:hypothetical protein